MKHSANSSFDAAMLIVAFLIVGILASRLVGRRRLVNSPGHFVRLRPHVDDPVASIPRRAALQYTSRGAQQHAVTDAHLQTAIPPSYSARDPGTLALVVYPSAA
ncbi:hypothetical protein J3A83DRAFT_4366919 [Scleroderma citrinum]